MESLKIMKLKIAIFISIIFLFLSINSFAQQKVTSLLKQVQPSTVLITIYDAQGNQSGQGSGFFISKEGEVITNWHVINDASSAMVKTSTGATFKVKGVVAKDEKRDIAKMVLEAKDVSFPYLKLSSTIPNVGEQIFVVGSPYGLESTVSDGLVSAVRKTPDIGQIIQISAPISPGSSGSPVINLNGQVVGIATFQLVKGQNLNFAISAIEVAKLSKIAGSVTPLSSLFLENKPYLSRINPEVQVQDNGWLKIDKYFVEELTAEEFYKEHMLESDKGKTIKKLHVKIQFLKPCQATTLFEEMKAEYDRDWEQSLKLKRPLSDKSQALFMLFLTNYAMTDGKTPKEKSDQMIKEYYAFCRKVGIDGFQLYMDISVTRYRCDYKIKVFTTFFAKEGYEIRTEGDIPLAQKIDSYSENRKTVMLPGETLWLSFIIPDDAVYWYVWVPK